MKGILLPLVILKDILWILLAIVQVFYYIISIAATNPLALDGSSAATKTRKFDWNKPVTAGHTYALAAFTTGYKGTMNPTGY